MIKKFIIRLILITFFFTSVGPLPDVSAQTLIDLPAPGVMVNRSDSFEPLQLKGILVNVKNPLRFDFLVDKGDSGLSGQFLKSNITRLAKYFLTCLAVPENDLWVNLSPYEKDRIVPGNFGITLMGKDLLEQDYLLKQIMASLSYPENDLGKEFWQKVYRKSYELYGTTEIPINTFNKVWITPKFAHVYVQGNAAFVVNSQLDVMLEADYKAWVHHLKDNNPGLSQEAGAYSQVFRDVILPELRQEINEGKNFAVVRQVYNAMILATWYKRHLMDSVLGRMYVGKNEVKGIDIADKDAKEKIFRQYLKAYKKCVYNYIKEDYDPFTQQTIPRKYASGGLYFAGFGGPASKDYAEVSSPRGMKIDDQLAIATINVAATGSDGAMLTFPDPRTVINDPHPFHEVPYEAHALANNSSIDNDPAMKMPEFYSRLAMLLALSIGVPTGASQQTNSPNPSKEDVDNKDAAMKAQSFVRGMLLSLAVASAVVPAHLAKGAQLTAKVNGDMVEVTATVVRGDDLGDITRKILNKYGMRKMDLWGAKGAVSKIEDNVETQIGRNVQNLRPGDEFTIEIKNKQFVTSKISGQSQATVKSGQEQVPIKTSSASTVRQSASSAGGRSLPVSLPNQQKSTAKKLSSAANHVTLMGEPAPSSSLVKVSLETLTGSPHVTTLTHNPPVDILTFKENVMFAARSAGKTIKTSLNSFYAALFESFHPTADASAGGASGPPDPLTTGIFQDVRKNLPFYVVGLGILGVGIAAMRARGLRRTNKKISKNKTLDTTPKQQPVAITKTYSGPRPYTEEELRPEVIARQWEALNALHQETRRQMEQDRAMCNISSHSRIGTRKELAAQGDGPLMDRGDDLANEDRGFHQGGRQVFREKKGKVRVYTAKEIESKRTLTGNNAKKKIRRKTEKSLPPIITQGRESEFYMDTEISHRRLASGSKVTGPETGHPFDSGDDELVSWTVKNGILVKGRSLGPDLDVGVARPDEEEQDKEGEQEDLKNEVIGIAHNGDHDAFQPVDGDGFVGEGEHGDIDDLRQLAIDLTDFQGELAKGDSDTIGKYIKYLRGMGFTSLAFNYAHVRAHHQTIASLKGDLLRKKEMDVVGGVADRVLEKYASILGRSDLKGEIKIKDLYADYRFQPQMFESGQADRLIRAIEERTGFRLPAPEGFDAVQRLNDLMEDRNFGHRLLDMRERGQLMGGPIHPAVMDNSLDQEQTEELWPEEIRLILEHFDECPMMDDQGRFRLIAFRDLKIDLVREFKKEYYAGTLPEKISHHWHMKNPDPIIRRFVSLGVYKFFTGDRPAAVKEFYQRSHGTHGLVIKDSNDLNGMTFASRGMDMFVGWNRHTGDLDGASSPDDLLRPYRDGHRLEEIFKLSSDGELVDVQVAQNGGEWSTEYYSMDLNRPLETHEVYERLAPLQKGNKYFDYYQQNSHEYRNQRTGILEDVNILTPSLARLERSFDEENANRMKSQQSFNYQGGMYIFRNLFGLWIYTLMDTILNKRGQYYTQFLKLQEKVKALDAEFTERAHSLHLDPRTYKNYKEFLDYESRVAPEKSMLMAILCHRLFDEDSLRLATWRINGEITQERLHELVPQAIEDRGNMIADRLSLTHLKEIYDEWVMEYKRPFRGKDKVGLIFGGDENSADGPTIGQEIWGKLFPYLKKRYKNAYEIMDYENQDEDPFTPAQVILTSKGGTNFNIRENLRVMSNTIGLKRISGVTSSPYSPLSFELGQRVRGESPFNGQLIYIGGPFHPQTQGASATLMMAAHLILPLFVARQFEKYCHGDHPFGLHLTPDRIEYMEKLLDEMLVKDAKRITGRDEEGNRVITQVNTALVKRGKYLARRLWETPINNWIYKYYVHLIVGFGTPGALALQYFHMAPGSPFTPLGAAKNFIDDFLIMGAPLALTWLYRLATGYEPFVNPGPPFNINFIGHGSLPDLDKMFLRVVFARAFNGWSSNVDSEPYQKAIPYMGVSVAPGSWIFLHVPSSADPKERRRSVVAGKQVSITESGLAGTLIKRRGPIVFATSRGPFKNPDVSNSIIDIGGEEFLPPDNDKMKIILFRAFDHLAAREANVVQLSHLGYNLSLGARLFSLKKVNSAQNLTTELGEPQVTVMPRDYQDTHHWGSSDDDRAMFAQNHLREGRKGGIDMNSQLMQLSLSGDTQNRSGSDNAMISGPIIKVVDPQVSGIVTVTPDMLKNMLGEGYLN